MELYRSKNLPSYSDEMSEVIERYITNGFSVDVVKDNGKILLLAHNNHNSTILAYVQGNDWVKYHSILSKT